MERRDFFISYTHKDEAWALWIAHVLMSHGYTVYIQRLDIKPGDNFMKKMNEFLKNCVNFITVWSEAYSKSRYCMTEMDAAFNEWHKKHINVFLPIRIENYPMEPLYAAMVHADLFGVSKEKAEKDLIEAVCSVVSHVEKESNATPMPDHAESTNEISLKTVIKSMLPVIIIVFICTAALVFRVPITRFMQDLSYQQEERELSGAELYQMGYNYCYGKNGVEQDYAKARKYFEQAAEQGNAEALDNLGGIYHNGWGVNQNYTKAREYYEQAAEQGYANALYNLANLYYNGFGVKQDYAKAREYFEQAAEQGYIDALCHLANLYREGWGVEQNYIKAREYYEQAAEQGNPVALFNLGTFYEFGSGIEQDYTKAREYYEKVAEQRDDMDVMAAALVNLGKLYHDGLGVEQDYIKAREYYEQAAEQGNAMALNNLAGLYADGLGVEQDYTKAREYYEQAVENGNDFALYNLGLLYEHGQGVEVNYPKAIEYYQKAAEKGNERAVAKVKRLREKMNG